MPGAVLASLAEELGLLGEQTQRLLRGAAVTGDPFEADVAIVAAGSEEAAAMDAFDELLDAGLIRSTEVPRRFRFRHPLVRRAVYESTPGGWLLGAHARAAQSLAARSAPAATRAHHVEFAARVGDTEAVAVLAEAGMAGLLRAPASAARWLSAALRILPADAPVQQRVGLLLARARALAAQGRLARATPISWRASRSLRPRPACSWSRRAPVSSACSAATPRRTRACWRACGSSRSRAPPTGSR